MTTPSDKPKSASFSSFGLGIALGVAGAFLFGTEEGRKLVKKFVDSIPERPAPRSMPFITPEETQHHATYEAPPPPPPSVRPSRPEPFTPHGESV